MSTRTKLVVDLEARIDAAQVLCREVDPEMLFPPPGSATRVAEAKGICTGCPVRGECLQLALVTNQSDGVWGGTTPKERKKLQKQMAVA